MVAASHTVLQPCIRRFQDARLALAAIDIPELAQRNLAALYERPEQGLACVAFDAAGGRLTVNYQGELIMARTIEAGRDDLSAAENDALRERVMLDIQRSLDNFDRNFGAISVPQLLVGPLPGGEIFVDYLRANLSVPVVVADLAEVLDVDAVPHLRQSADQAGAWWALGAALRQ